MTVPLTDLTEKPNVVYGEWEHDEDATPVGRVARSWDGREFVVWERPLRRKRLVRWRDSDGNTWGRWTWEYAA